MAISQLPLCIAFLVILEFLLSLMNELKEIGVCLFNFLRFIYCKIILYR